MNKEAGLDYKDKVVDTSLIFEATEYMGDIDFNYAVVKGRVQFVDCVFNGDVIFGYKEDKYCCFIEQDIEFLNCQFTQNLYLDGIKCEGSIMIKGCSFSDDKCNNFNLRAAKIGTSLLIQESSFKGGIDLSDSTIELKGCVFDELYMNAPKSWLNLHSLDCGKELQFIGCNIYAEFIGLDNLKLNDKVGNLQFIGKRTGAEFKDEDFQNILKEHEFKTDGELITLDTDNGTYLFKKGIDDTYEEWYLNSIRAEKLIFLQNSSLGNTFFIEMSKLKADKMIMDESETGSLKMNYSFFDLSICRMESAVIRNNFDVSKCLFNIHKYNYRHDNLSEDTPGILLTSAVVESNMIISECIIKDRSKSNDGCCLRLDHIKVQGILELNNIQLDGIKELDINLECARSTYFDLNLSENKEQQLSIRLEESNFDIIRVNGKALDYETLLKMMDSKDLKIMNKKQRDLIIKGDYIGAHIETGVISFLRNCENQLINREENYEEANKIWRLRNRLRLYREHGYKKTLKYYLHHGWDVVTDYGLSSTNILAFVCFIFVIYCGINLMIVNIDAQINPERGSIDIIGQSLIQYIPTIDFGDELKIINFEKGLPSYYKYLVIFARISGFVLISILVASFGGLWKGRNK